jgi:hypothetical protein
MLEASLDTRKFQSAPFAIGSTRPLIHCQRHRLVARSWSDEVMLTIGSFSIGSSQQGRSKIL